MKKDIAFLPVEGVNIAVAKEINELNEAAWSAYLINYNKVEITNIFITSKGYGISGDVKQETSVLRHHFSRLGAGEHIIIEILDPAVFHLNNEYWLSYFLDNQIYDKKFIFLPESIIEENIIFIPQLNLEGILHS